ncbi:MAG: hypothetical protein AAB626_01515 [Patescibacteria group bacterium]
MTKISKKIHRFYNKTISKYSRRALIALASLFLSVSLTSTALAISFYGPELTNTVPFIGPIMPVPAKTASRLIEVDLTAYSSTEDQTDSTPFIAASGKYVYDGMVATNFLPFGTKIKIPALYGDRIFTVDDRMNRRYQNRVDIWFADRESAMNFGLQRTVIEIVPTID